MSVKPLILATDGSVEDSAGKTLLFSVERFIEQIVKLSNCFICGATPTSTEFNDEHVLPDWILKRFELHSRLMTLPNQTYTKYKHLKVPCCRSCNSLMGGIFEGPLREMFELGYQGFLDALSKKSPAFLFDWLALIFLKMHLKDKNTRMYRDSRAGDGMIAELYDWTELHHIHCLCRRFYTGVHLHPSAAGSLLILPAKTQPHIENFDFLDLHMSQTIMLRIDDVAILSTLNDHCAGATVLNDRLQVIEGPLSPLQLRELAALLACANMDMTPRPRFFSEFDSVSGEGYIRGDDPFEFSLPEFRNDVFGPLLYRLCEDFFTRDVSETVKQHVKSGRWTFLTTEDGKFAHDSFDLIPPD